VTSYGLDDRGIVVRVPVVWGIVSFPMRLWGQPSLLFNGYKGIFPQRLKPPGREAHHSLPTFTEVRKMWIYASMLNLLNTGISLPFIDYLLLPSVLTYRLDFIYVMYPTTVPITVADRSKAWTLFACSNTGFNSHSHSCLCVFIVFCVLFVMRVGRGLAMGWSSTQWVLGLRNLKSHKVPTK
jgi:hypothetical protein